MVKRKLRVLEMLNAISRYYKKNQAVIESSPARKAVFVIFVARLFKLNGWVEITKKDISGITTDKKELKKMLAAEVAEVAAQAHSWAFLNGDAELLKATGYKEYQLMKLGDTNMEKTCGAMLGTITSRNAEMGDHQVEQGRLDYVTDMLELFRGKKPDTRGAEVGHSTLLKNSNKEITYLNNFLDEAIDGLMLPLKKTHPLLHEEYLMTRDVLESGSRQTKVSGLVTNSKGVPLIKAKAEAIEAEKGTRFETFTDGKGLYDLKIPEAGRYTLVVSYDGSETFSSEPFDISPGDQLKIYVTLTQISV